MDNNTFKQQRLDAYAQFERRQLIEWQVKVKDWPLYTEDGRHMRCRECHQNVYFICDAGGHSYMYSIEEIEALTIAHVRQVHNDQREAEILGDTVPGTAIRSSPSSSDRSLDQDSYPRGVDKAPEDGRGGD